MTPDASTKKPAPTILVIEDYSDTRQLLSGMLRYRGFNVVEAEDGLEGLLKASSTYPDLIILDLAMPQMDGVEAARRIHAQPKLARTPIIVISAFVTKEVAADVRAAGCVAIFPKPFDVKALLAKIRSTLE